MKIIALSGSQAAIPSLNHLFKTGDLVALICPTATIGLDMIPIESWASENGVPCWQVAQSDIENELDELIRETVPDLILVYGFPYALSRPLLQDVKHGAWNVHFSLHPDHKSSITIHQLSDVSSGEQVIHQCSVALLPDNEAGSPINQMSLLSVALLQDAIRSLKERFGDGRNLAWWQSVAAF